VPDVSLKVASPSTLFHSTQERFFRRMGLHPGTSIDGYAFLLGDTARGNPN
jgi:hypothetical protein